MTEKALRYNSDKLRVDLIPPESTEALGRVLGYGCKKYAERNWEKGMRWMKDVGGSIIRHYTEFSKGNDIDEESGISHVELMHTNTAFLLTYFKRNIGTDDRPNRLTLAKAVDGITEENRHNNAWAAPDSTPCSDLFVTAALEPYLTALLGQAASYMALQKEKFLVLGKALLGFHLLKHPEALEELWDKAMSNRDSFSLGRDVWGQQTFNRFLGRVENKDMGEARVFALVLFFTLGRSAVHDFACKARAQDPTSVTSVAIELLVDTFENEYIRLSKTEGFPA